MFNISVSSVIKTGKDSTTSMTVTETMEADSTSGKTNIWKQIVHQVRQTYRSILIYVKNGMY